MNRDLIPREIEEQPALFERGPMRIARDIARRLQSSEEIVLTGCGDSRSIAEFVARIFRRAGISARAAAPVDALEAPLRRTDRQSTLIGVSISGRTPTVQEVIDRYRAKGIYTLAVTDDVASPVALAADDVLSLNVNSPKALDWSPYWGPLSQHYTGYRTGVGQTLTVFAGFLRAFELVGAVVGSRLMTPWSYPKFGPWLREAVRARRAMTPLAAKLSSCNTWIFAGQGLTLPIASYGAAKFQETGFRAIWCELEEFGHTYLYGSDSRTCLIAAPGSRRDDELVRTIYRAAGSILHVHSWDRFPALVRPPQDVDDPAVRALCMMPGIQVLWYLVSKRSVPDVNRWRGGKREEEYVHAAAQVNRGLGPRPRPRSNPARSR